MVLTCNTSDFSHFDDMPPRPNKWRRKKAVQWTSKCLIVQENLQTPL
jgi:hypothetical protein